MKPFLGIDLTDDKKNEQHNGLEFCVQKPSAALTQSLERSSENAEQTVKKSKLPLPLRICQYVCGLLGVMVPVAIIRALGEGLTLAQVYGNASELIWIAGGCLLVWGVLKIIATKKEKAVLETEESDRVITNLEGVCNAIYSELAVPSDAKEADILYFYYKIKKDKMKICEKGLQPAPYLNPIFKVYADADNLYIANLETKWAFPRASLKAIRRIKKHIRIAQWNKEAPCDKGVYKQYKLITDQYHCVHCKEYCILEVEDQGRIWGIYIPCYELSTFEALTGLKAKTE